MWKYEKKLEYPINIKNKDLRMAKALLAQYGGTYTNGDFLKGSLKMQCKNLRIRSKKGNKFIYCNLLKKEIAFNSCKDCEHKEYKIVKFTTNQKFTINQKYCANSKSNTQLNQKHCAKIKPISKKREFVSKETYNIVFNRCNGRCAICGSYKDLQLHHINGRGKGKTDNPNNCIILCRTCHLDKVHMNNKYWRKELNKMINN